MVNPVNKKRDRDDCPPLVVPLHTTPRRFNLLESLNEATEKVERLFFEIAAAPFRVPNDISNVVKEMLDHVTNADNRSPTLSKLLFVPTKMARFFSYLERIETNFKIQTANFNEIIDRSFKLIGEINKLSPLDNDSLASSSVISDLIVTLKQIECDFIEIGSALQNFSEEVEKLVLQLHLATELESARVKYLEIRKVLSDKGLLGPSDLLRPIPQFFLNLDVFNYQRALLPVAHRLSREKYLSKFRFTAEAAVLSRDLTRQEKDRITLSYNELAADLKKDLEGYAAESGYLFPGVEDIPVVVGEDKKYYRISPEDDAENYYRISAKILREWIHTFPNLEPKVVDPRTFALVEETDGSLLEDFYDASDSKENDEVIALSSSRGYAPARFGALSTPSLSPHTGPNLDPRSFETRIHLSRYFSSAQQQVARKVDLGSSFTLAGQFRLEPFDPTAIDKELRRQFEGYMTALNEQDPDIFIRSYAGSAHEPRALFDRYIEAVVEDNIQAGIDAGELPPSARELPIRDYINVVSRAVEGLCSTRSNQGMDDDLFNVTDIATQASTSSVGDFDLVDIYNFIVSELSQLTEEEKANSILLQDLIRGLNLPAPILQRFYANVTKVATETGLLPLEAEDNWAESNYSTSYLFIEQGLFRTVSEILTEDARKVFDTWGKVYTMPEPRNEAAVRSIIESKHFSDAQVSRFYEEVKRAHLRNHPETQESDLPHSWPQDNAYTDYSRTLCALSLLLVHEFSIQGR